jgi:hypothetical protein
MKLKDILKEENWKADKNVITLDGEKVGDYSFDRDADGFFIDDISGKGQKGFDTKGEMIDYIKKNKSAYLKARKAYASRGYMHEGLDPKAQRFLDAIQVIDRDIKDLKNITVDATPQGNWSVYFKGKRMGTINGKMLGDDTIMKYGLEESVSKSINEAEEVQLADLQPTQQKQVKAFEQLLDGKADSIFDGIHGFIVDIKVSGGHGPYRFDTDDLKKLVALKIRWVEANGTTISVAF